MSFTIVERLEFIARHLGVVHALEQRLNPCIFFAPEVVRDCQVSALEYSDLSQGNVQDIDTVGTSATVPGIVPQPAAQAAVSMEGAHWLGRCPQPYQVPKCPALK